jgi:hypothetical protein
VVDEPQATLQSLLSDIDMSNILEVWIIRRIGGISRKKNLVALLADGTHICTCMETITKGIICRHFWRTMLYSSSARFHISIIPSRWYKDTVLTKLNANIKSSPILTAIESSTTSPSFQVTFTLQSLYNLQGSNSHDEKVDQKISQRNRFGAAFSVAKTAVNIALENNKDSELIQLLKRFIAEQQRIRDGNDDTYDIADEDIIQNDNELIPLQKHLIDQTNNPQVTKIRGAPCKRRMKNGIEMFKKNRILIEEVNQTEECNQTGRQQRKCLLCGKPGHYQKKCPNGKEGY